MFGKLYFSKGQNSCESRSNLVCITSRQIHIQCTKFQVNISRDDGEKFGELNFSKGQYHMQRGSSVTKIEL